MAKDTEIDKSSLTITAKKDTPEIDGLKKHQQDPFFKQQVEEAKVFLKKFGLPKGWEKIEKSIN